MNPVDVSIVICTHNRADMLRDALESLVAQETAGEFTYDIVVVNNASKDHTAAIVKEIASQTDVRIHYVEEPKAGQVFARNRGLSETNAEWIANFDDDQFAEPQWLLELVRTARAQDALCVGGKLDLALPTNCGRTLAALTRRLLGESVRWESVQPYSRKYGPGSGNQLLHRQLFEELGRYNEDYQLRGYDTDMYRRIRSAGHVSWFTPNAIAYHVTPPNRLTTAYLKETALHNGWSFAKRDLSEWGLGRSVVTALARAGHAAMLAPRRLWNLITRDKESALADQCQIWRAEGYIRCILYAASPRVFSQQTFFDRYEFRYKANV